MVYSWVLITVFSGSFGGATGSVLFVTKPACEKAVVVLTEQAPASKILAFCTELR